MHVQQAIPTHTTRIILFAEPLVNSANSSPTTKFGALYSSGQARQPLVPQSSFYRELSEYLNNILPWFCTLNLAKFNEQKLAMWQHLLPSRKYLPSTLVSRTGKIVCRVWNSAVSHPVGAWRVALRYYIVLHFTEFITNETGQILCRLWNSTIIHPVMSWRVALHYYTVPHFTVFMSNETGHTSIDYLPSPHIYRVLCQSKLGEGLSFAEFHNRQNMSVEWQNICLPCSGLGIEHYRLRNACSTSFATRQTSSIWFILLYISLLIVLKWILHHSNSAKIDETRSCFTFQTFFGKSKNIYIATAKLKKNKKIKQFIKY